jgi:hypothetical protein
MGVGRHECLVNAGGPPTPPPMGLLLHPQPHWFIAAGSHASTMHPGTASSAAQWGHCSNKTASHMHSTPRTDATVISEYVDMDSGTAPFSSTRSRIRAGSVSRIILRSAGKPRQHTGWGR